MKRNQILVIIVTYNAEQWIVNCINSILKSDVLVDIICIDNNSTDNTIDLIKNNFPTVFIKKSEINLGFGQANNLGFDFAINNKYDFLFLLNQDTVIKPDAIYKLYQNYKKDVKFGILSPLHLDGSCNYLDVNFEYFLRNQKKSRFLSNYFLNKNNSSSTFMVGFINAAAWFISVETVKKVGYFNPLFYHYGEDLDWYNRLIFHNLNCFIQGDSRIIHFFPQESGREFIGTYKKAKREYAERLATFTNINRSFFSVFKTVYSLSFRNLFGSILFFRIKAFYFESLIFFWLFINTFKIKKYRQIAKKSGAFI